MVKKKAKIVYEEPKGKKDYFFPIALVVVALVIVGILSNGTFFVDKILEPKEELVIGDQSVLVTVNGESIYKGELDEYWDKLPPQYKLQLTREDLLEEFIQERLLLQEAGKKGISASDAEVDEYIIAQLTQMGLSKDQFEELLAAQGTDLARMEDIYKRQLTLAKLFEQQDNNDLNSTNEEVSAYYTENTELFFQSEQVTARHILIPVNDNVNDSEAQIRVEEIEALLDEGTDFCELVSEFSADPGSVANCGEYTFPKGVMVQEFEDVSFDLEIGERGVAKTTFGYHIIVKDGEIDAGTAGLDDVLDGEKVSDIVRRILAEEKAKAIYEQYIAELRADAEIVYASENEEIELDEEKEDEIVEIMDETDENEELEDEIVQEIIEVDNGSVDVVIEVQ